MAKRGWSWLLVGALAVAGAWVFWRQALRPPPLSLAKWNGVVAVAPAPPGLDWTPVDQLPEVDDALLGTSPDALREALSRAGVRGLWVPSSPGPSTGDMPLEERFSSGAIVRGFRGEALTETGLLYVVDNLEWDPVLVDRVLARVARGILEGSTPPPLDAFPSPLTEPQPVEVLVVLMSGRGPRLWRSARSPSMADGVITAALAARKRWEERAETMGGPLRERLNELDVHVAFLFDDGTFDRSAVPLIDALVKPGHGVAYEQPSRWRYLLPRTTHDADTPTDAFRRLFRDNGLPEDSFERRDLRLYRMRMQTVSVDQGSTGSSRTGVPSGSASAD